MRGTAGLQASDLHSCKELARLLESISELQAVEALESLAIPEVADEALELLKKTFRGGASGSGRSNKALRQAAVATLRDGHARDATHLRAAPVLFVHRALT